LVYANLMYTSAGKRGAYVLASVPVAVLANGIRTTSIVFITHISDGQIGLAQDHATYGWVVFLFAVAGQMWAGWRYRDPHEQSPATAPFATRRVLLKNVALAWFVAVCAIVAAPGYAALAATEEALPDGSLCWPALPIDGYTIVQDPPWQPRFAQAHGDFHALVESEFGLVDLHVAYYWRQRQGAELINWRNRVYDGARWNFMARTAEELTVDGQPVSVIKESLRGPRYEMRTVFYWYWVDGRLVGSALLAKLLQVKAALLFGEKRAAMIALSVDEGVAGQRAREVVQSILNRAPFVVRTLQRVRTTVDGESNC
ncbi:MAG: EpsI family protein, partial [Gammaproteobacteria bacterium]|nr:EpsI family protein [Gammaproteobacteria bacterium]